MINVRMHGARGDGVANDSSAFASAIADMHAISPRQPIYVPGGTYLLSNSISVTGAATFIGDGLRQSELRWITNAATRGIYIAPTNATDFAHVRDLRFTTFGTTGAALTLDYRGQMVSATGGTITTMDRINPRFLIESCMFSGAGVVDSGDPFTNAWQDAVDVISGVGGAIRDCLSCGLAASIYSGTTNYSGFSFYGEPITGAFENGHPVQFVVDNCTLWFSEFGIAFYNCEGCYVVNSNVIGCNYGIYALSQYSHPQVVVANTHSNCFIRPILIEGMTQINISGSLLYMIQNSTNGVCLELVGNGHTGTIMGNTCVSLSSNATGIAVNGFTHLAIAANAFLQVGTNMPTGIWLTANASECRGSMNIFNGTFVNTVLDNGTSNSVT